MYYSTAPMNSDWSEYVHYFRLKKAQQFKIQHKRYDN